MKKTIIILAGVFGILGASAQKTVVRDPNAQVRNVGSFHAIQVSNAIDLYLNQGGEEAVAVSARDEKYISQKLLRRWTTAC